MSKSSIKLLSEYFHPEPASTGQLMTQLTVGLKNKGFDLEAYTSQPTYQGQEKKKLTKEESYKGVKITRVFSTQLDKEKSLFRIINWLTFSFSVFCKLIFRRNQESVLLIVTNPPILPVVGLMLKYLRRQHYVLITL